MIFVDTNVFMYAVGREHVLREPAQQFFHEHFEVSLCTSAEVMQELLHAYLPVQRMVVLDKALRLLESRITTIWSVSAEDVIAAKHLSLRYPKLDARDLLHVACCQRYGVKQLKTFDSALNAVFAT